MIKQVICTCALGVSVVISLLFPSGPDYSYSHWYEGLGNPKPGSCDLSSTVYCKETGLAPDRSQTVLWSSYIVWDSCVEFKDNLSCKELEN